MPVFDRSWWKGNWWSLVVAGTATAYCLYYARTAADWHFIDSFNLLVHETGHLVFVPFGELLTTLGGSLFQIIVPAVFVGYFVTRSDYFSAALTTFWVGINVINVSVYARDAIVMQLPLITGDNLGHDWHNALSMMGLLRHTESIGLSIYVTGIATVMLAACMSILFSQIPQARK